MNGHTVGFYPHAQKLEPYYATLIAVFFLTYLAAGQDSVTRIWSVASGELLHSIPFPDSVDRSVGSIPALYYSEEWGGKGGMPGLLYGAGDTIYSYTY